MKEYKDPSQNFLEGYQNPINSFFNPQSVALIGATEKDPSVARTILNNLLHHGYQGKIYPINPKYEKVLGVKCYPDIKAIDEKIDLVVIVTPAKTVPALVKDCVDCQVDSIIIISAGFKEAGDAGKKLEEDILRTIQNTKTRIIGPNCLGLMNPHRNLNATFSADMALKGNLAFISQSGAMCTSVLDWSLKEKVGFSAFISIGSMSDVQFGDLIEYLGHDPKTEIILIYMETIGDARIFLSAAKKVALTKPIVLIKAGRTQAAKKAAASHTGSLAGSDDAFDAAIRRVGVLRVNQIEELFDMASALSKQPMPKGPNLTIITNAGGPAVLATDGTILSGAKMTELHPKTIELLNQFLPAAWSHSNPVDILGDATDEAYAKSLEVVAHDPHTDGVLVILTPQDMTKPLETAQAVSRLSHLGKPVLASWMGGAKLDSGIHVLHQNNIPNFPYPDEAAKVFGTMWTYHENLRALYETPAIRDEDFDKLLVEKRIEIVEKIFHHALKEGRTILTEFESKKILEAYDIPTVKTVVCHTVDEAIKQADAIGYPIVLKLHSDTITHKSDVGGVKLNLKNSHAVKEAYHAIEEAVTKHHSKKDFGGVSVQQMISLKGTEILVGSIVDDQFGPVIMFGTGGVLVEVFKDRALSIPPLNSTLAMQMMSQTKIYEALKGVRGKEGVSFEKLEKILINFSKLILEHPRIKECDINPLLASAEQIIALDARFVINTAHEPIVSSAMRAYPTEYIKAATLKDGSDIRIRPVRPEDEPKVKLFHEELSENTVRARYLSLLSLEERTSHERLIQICSIDYGNEMRLIAEDAHHKIVGIASYRRLPNSKDADFKLTLVDRIQGKGLGTVLLEHLIHIAKEEKLKKLTGSILDENTHLLEMCKKHGFKVEKSGSHPKLYKATLKLS
jgi:acetyltransferase